MDCRGETLKRTSKTMVITAIASVIFICAVFLNRYVYNIEIPAFLQKPENISGQVEITGTFIQTWIVKNWTEEMWGKEFDSLKEAGIKYIVLSPTLFHMNDEKSGEKYIKTVYPSNIEETTMFYDSQGIRYPDVVKVCLENASKRGMKVFIGLNYSDDWWEMKNNEIWVYSMMNEGNEVADELWEMYHDKYPDAFYGWYWCWEVDNFYFSTLDIFKKMRNMLANAIKIHMEHFDENGMHLPFMISPYMNYRLGFSTSYSDMWEYVFKNSGMKAGDIFCPQDSVGAGGLKIEILGEWFDALKNAANSVPGIELWADVEAFEESDWTAATLDRVLKQMKETDPYVKEFILFTYTHYYSPETNSTGFHNTYLDYLEKGELDAFPPLKPSGLEAVLKDERNVKLTWNAPYDDTGVCGYNLYRSGEFLVKKQNHINMEEVENYNTAVNEFLDLDLKENSIYSYSIEAYDYAGNISPRSREVFIKIP
jgi:hypothetical protein